MKGSSRFFLDISIDAGPVHRIIIETFDQKFPKTVYNFKCLCTGEKGISANGTRLWYKDSIFHRVVDGFMIQGGDISLGSGGESIYGGLFEDEETGSFEEPWLVAMANKGKDANGSQFFITTEAAPHLNGEAVVYGHVISGFEVIKQIEKLPTNEHYIAESKVVISNCGELIRKKKVPKEESLKEKEADSEIYPKDSINLKELETAGENEGETGREIAVSNDIEEELIPETKKDIQAEEDGSISEENEYLDSDYEYPSVQVPHFNEPKSYLDRGGRDPGWKPLRSIHKDKDGRKVKGRGNLKFSKPDSFRGDPYKRSRDRSPRRYSRSPRRSTERSPKRSRDRWPKISTDRSHRERSPRRSYSKYESRQDTGREKD